MDGSVIFKKLRDSVENVYLYDKYEECVLKYFVGKDGKTVQAMLKKKGQEPYLGCSKEIILFYNIDIKILA